MKVELKNKVVLVTGASRGIGKAIVRELGKAGANVAIHYNQNQEAALHLKKELGDDRAVLFQADLNDPKACKSLILTVWEKMGKIDVLVNNAGVVKAILPETDLDDLVQAWNYTLQVNLVSCGILCHTILPLFEKQGIGRIIHIASRAAFRGDTPEYMAYAASKGGMVSLSRSIARYYGKKGITSFVVAPGFTKTDMAQEFIDTYGEDIVLNDLALSKLTEPEDVSPTVLFLASGHMDHATGCTIDINAGSYVR